MTDDAHLLRQYADTGSESAFAEIVRRHLNLVYFTALRRLDGDEHAAKDACQNTFVRLARKAQAVSRHPTVAGWLYVAVNRESSSLIRTARRRLAREQTAASLLNPSSEEISSVDARLLRPMLDEAILRLPVLDREAVVLRFFEGYPYAQVGARLGISAAAAQKRAERALERMRAFLAHRNVGSSSAALALVMENQSGLTAPIGLDASISAAAMFAAGKGAGFGSLLTAMTATKSSLTGTGFIAVATLIGILGIGFGIRSLVHARGVSVELAAAQNDITARYKVLDQQHQAFSAAERDIASIQSQLATSSHSSQSRISASAAVNTGREELMKFLTAVPQARGILQDIFVAEASRTYGPFFRSTGMSASGIAAFENAVANARFQSLEMNSAGGFNDTSRVLPPDDQLQSILGEEQYGEFKDFVLVSPAFSFAGQAAVSAALAGVPLSTDQQDQLVEAVIQHGSASPNGDVDLSSVDWNAASSAAKAILTPAQWNAVQVEFLRNQYQQAVQAASASHG